MFIGKSSEAWRDEQREKAVIDSLKEIMPVHYRYFAFLDVGKIRDRSCLAICREVHDRKIDMKTCELVYLRPLKLGVSYIDQAAGVRDLLDNELFELWPLTFMIDAGGPGEVLADVCQRMGMKPMRTIITGGNESTMKNGRLKVPRNVLFQTLMKYLIRPDFRIAGDLPFFDELQAELVMLTPGYGNNGAFYINSGAHDDLAISVAGAVFGYARHGRSRQGVTTLY
ncbi:hypothetical protein ACFOOP_14190 [Marinicaulis aureus]|uniref:Terminase large subunit gp17-like C-terminal domain-containing protein n=1 Tax=Hyphococcus aureus TaxID=2666033 RepID=A0ABW1L1X4_9PROT